MANKKPTTEVTLLSEYPQFKHFVDYAAKLPPDTLYTPAQRHALHEKQDLPLARALFIMANDSRFPNLKFKVFSDKYTFVNIDVDDKDGKSVGPKAFSRFKKEFRIPDSATIKSPTHDGFHVHLLIPKTTPAIIKNEIPNHKDIEIFVDDSFKNQRYMMPGNTKDGGVYELMEDLPISVYNGQLVSALQTQWDQKNQHSQQNIQRNEKLFGKVDSEECYRQAVKYCRSVMDSGEVIEEGCCDDRFSFHAWNIFEIGLGRVKGEEVFKTHIWKQESIHPIEQRDEAHVDELLDRAFKRVSDNRALGSKADIMEPWEVDANGYVNIKRKDMDEKLDFVLDKSPKMRLQPSFRRITFETIFKSEAGSYYKPERHPYSLYEEEYAFALIGAEKPLAQINFYEPLTSLKGTKTHWINVPPKTIDENYRVAKGKRSASIRSLPEFHDNVLEAKVHESPFFGSRDYIYRNGHAWLNTYDCLDLLSDAEYEIVSDDVDRLESELFDFIIEEDDRDQFRMRIAKIVQNPQDNIHNIIVLYGPGQGSGKTTLVNLIGYMIPDDKFITHGSINETTEKFTENRLVTLYDDVNTNKIKDINQLKHEATAIVHKIEKKFIQAIYVHEPVNFFFTTNDEPHKRELLTGRRWSVYAYEKPFSRRTREFQIPIILRELQANNYYLYRALKTKWMNLDVSMFDQSYKTSFQRQKYSQAVRGAKIIPYYVALIHNQGYMNGQQIIVPGENTNRLDAIVLERYYSDLVNATARPNKEYSKPENVSIRSLFNFNTNEEGANYYATWTDLCKDPEKSIKSRINSTWKPVWSNEYPDFEEMIAFVAYLDTGDPSVRAIKETEEKYHFGEKTDTPLGEINPYEEFGIQQALEEAENEE